MHEEPLHLLPMEMREAFLAELRSLHPDYPYPLEVEGDLCPVCRFMMREALGRHGGGTWRRSWRRRSRSSAWSSRRRTALASAPSSPRTRRTRTPPSSPGTSTTARWPSTAPTPTPGPSTLTGAQHRQPGHRGVH
jgi:hypothetical protein